MRKGMRKILSACLALVMVMSLLPAPVLAVSDVQPEETLEGQTLFLPVIEQGEEAPEPQGYGVSAGNSRSSLTPNTAGCSYAYAGAESIYINNNIIINDPNTGDPVTVSPAANGLLQIVNDEGDVLASSAAIASYTQDYDESYYISYEEILDTENITDGTYGLQLSAGNVIYPCSGSVIVVGNDSLLITRAYVNGLYTGVDSFEVNMQLYGFETEDDLANLSFQLLDSVDTVIAESTGAYRDISANYTNEDSWSVYAQMAVSAGQSIQSGENYGLKISYTGDKVLVDGVGAVTMSAYTPSVSIENFKVLDPQIGTVQITMENWSAEETYRVTVSNNDTEYGSWEGNVPDTGVVTIQLQFNGMTVPMTSYGSQLYVEVYEGEETYHSDGEYFDNPYYNLNQSSIYLYPYYLKPTSTEIPFTIEYYNCSYVIGEGDVLSMRDSSGTEVGGCSFIANTRDGTSGKLTGTLFISGSLTNNTTYYLYINDVQFDTIYATETLALSTSIPMANSSAKTFWTNLGVFPIEVNAINSSGTGYIVFKSGNTDVLSSESISGAASEYYDHQLYAYTFTSQQIAALTSGQTYTLVFRDSDGTEDTLYSSTGLTYSAEKTALDFSNNNHAYIRWYDAMAGDITVATQLYFGNNNGPKNITASDLETAVKALSLSSMSGTVSVTGYQNGTWSDNGYSYKLELVLSASLATGDYSVYSDEKKIDTFTVKEAEQNANPRIYNADADAALVNGANLPTDGIYTGKLYSGYTCLTNTAFPMTLQGENNGITQYLYFSKTLLANLDAGDYELRVYMGSSVLGSATLTIHTATQPIISVNDDDSDWSDDGNPVMQTANVYIEGNNMGAYGYLRWAETEDALKEVTFQPYFSNYRYDHTFTGDDGLRTLYVELSKTGDASAVDNLFYDFDLWLCTDGDYDVQVPEEIQGVKIPSDDTYTITATTELPATNLWISFYDVTGAHADRQMTYVGRAQDGRYEFSLTFDVSGYFYDNYYTNEVTTDLQEYQEQYFYFENTQSIRVFATDLSNKYNENEQYGGNVVGIPVERVLIFGNPKYIILPQFTKSGVLTNQTSYTLYGYATPNSTVTISEDSATLGTATAGNYGYFTITLSSLTEGAHTLSVSDSSSVQPEIAPVLTVDTTAPVVSSVGFTFLTDGNAVVRWTCVDTDVDYFQIYKNSMLLGRAAADTTSYNVAASADDGNTFTIKVFDKAGNVGEKTASTADTENPTAPGEPISTGKTTASVTLSWTAGTDNMGVAGYNIYQGGTKMAETTGENVLTYTVTGLVQGTEYSFTVKTRDRAGNVSPDSTALTVSTVGLTLSSPKLQSGYIVDEFSDKNIPVDFTVSANTEGYAATLSSARIEYRTADAEESAPWSSGSMTCSGSGASGYWNVSGSEDGYLPMGNYKVRFAAKDDQDATVTSNPVNVVLLKRDTVAPTVPGTPIADSHSTTSITFHWEASTDNVAVTSYIIYRDAIRFNEITGTHFTDTGLEMGKSYSYMVKAVDARGNISSSSDSASMSTMTLAFDSVIDFDGTYTLEEQSNKQIAIWAKFKPEEGYAPDVTMSMEFNTGDEEEWTSVTLTGDDEDANRFEGTWPLSGSDDGYLSAGSYSVRFAVTDGSATAYSEVQTVSLQRDAEKPVMTSLMPATGTYGGKALPISAAATDNVGVTRILLSYSADGENFTEITTLANTYGDSPFSDSYIWSASALSSGSYIIKAVAYDLRGNASDAKTSTITLDNNPPEMPSSFTVTGTSRYIHVMWDSAYQAPADFSRFNVYRATATDGEYTRVGGGRAIGFYDDGETATAGSTYYYYVTAEDNYGNESTATQVISAMLVADSESPTIGDMLPRENAALRKTITLSVTAADNYRLAKAVFEYQINGDTGWIQIAEVPVTNVTSNTTFSHTWDISSLAAGSYMIRASVYDDSINNVGVGSGYTANTPAKLVRTVEVKAYSAPVAPVATLQNGYKTTTLSWTYSGSLDTLKQFEVYRTDANGDHAENVAVVKAGASGNYTASIPVEVTQYFKIAAKDDYGAYAYSNVVSAVSAGSDTEDPAAVILPETLTAAAGVAFWFSGAGSTDNSVIASYEWSFGDGATNSSKNCTHIYSAAGTYIVTLTVTDECGNTDTATATMTVYDVTGENATYALMTINVVNGYAEGTPAIEGAEVKVYNGETKGSQNYFETTAVTDSVGQVTVVVPIGDCTVSVVADGYVSTGRAVTVEPEDDGTFAYTVGLAAVNVSTVDGSLTSTEMTYDEILAVGIDVTDPNNEHVWKFAAELHFVAGAALPFDLPVVAYYNEAGDFLGGSGWGWIGGGNGGGGGLNIGLFPISENFVLVIYGEAHWLKEMYNVELLVINNSYTDDITNCVAALDLPEGLSLAAMIGEEQTATINIGTVNKKQTADASANIAKVNWYVRGDAEGEYNLTATVTGNNPTPFVKAFTTDKPVKVYAGSALHLTITAEDIAYRGEEYHVQFKLENVSDKDLYNLSFGITGAEQFKVFGFGSATAEFPLTREDFGDSMTQSIDILKPGGSITIDFTTTTWFNSALELADLGPLDVGYYLTDVFVTTLEGSTTEIPYTVNITHAKHGSFFEWLWGEAKDFVKGESIDIMDEDFAGDVGLLKNGKKVYKFLTEDTTDAGSTAVITIEGGSFTSSNNFLRSLSANAVSVYTDADEENYTISADGRTLTLTGSANIYVEAETAGNATMTVTTKTYDAVAEDFVPNTYQLNYTVSSEEGTAQQVILQKPESDTAAVPLAGSAKEITFPHALLDASGNYLSDASDTSWTITGTDTTGLSIENGVLTITSTAKAGEYTIRLALSSTEYAEQTITLTREESAATTVKLYRDGNELAAADTLVIPVADDTNTYTYTAKLFDQYGVEMNSVFDWQVTGNSSGASLQNGAITLTKDTDLGALTLTASASGKSESVKVTITNLAVDWNTVKAAINATTYTYGDSEQKATLPTSGSASVGSITGITGFFSYVNNKTPDAGSYNITVRFTVTDSPTNTAYVGTTVDKDFTVTVGAKALTVTPDALSRVYGSDDPTFTYNTSGQADQEIPAFTGTLARAGGTEVGEYAVSVGTLALVDSTEKDGFKAANYILSFTSGVKYTINQAVITAIDETAPSHTLNAYEARTYSTKDDFKSIANNGNALPDAVTVKWLDSDDTAHTEDIAIIWANATESWDAKGGTYTYVGSIASATGMGKNFAVSTKTLTATVTVTAVTVQTAAVSPTAITRAMVDIDNAADYVTLGLPTTVAVTYVNGVTGGNLAITGWSMTLDQLKAIDASSADVTRTLTPTFVWPVWATTIASPTVAFTVTDKYPVTVTASAPSDITYGGTLGEPSASQTEINDHGTEPDEAFRYEYKLTSAPDSAYTETVPKSAGDYTVRATLKSDTHSGCGTAAFTIAKKVLADSMIAEITAAYTYDGTEKKPVPAVSDMKDGIELISALDYTVSYSDNVNAGMATVTIAAKDASNYTGSASRTFTISLKSIANTSVTVSDIPDLTYTGSVIEPFITVMDGAALLIKDTDYTVTFSNNTNAGTATLTVTGKGNYTGFRDVTFFILPKPIIGTVNIGATVANGTDSTKIDADDTLTLIRSTGMPDGGTVTWYDVDDTLLGTGNPYTVTAADAGKTIHAIYEAPANYTGTLITGVIEVGKAFINGALTIKQSGPVNKATTLSLTESSNVNGDAVSAGSAYYTLQWYRGGEPIEGATGITYTSADADRGCAITLRATAKGDTYTGTLTSVGVYVNTEAPTLSLNATTGNKQVALRWSVTDDGGSDITKFVIYKDSGTGITLANNVTSYTFTDLENGTEYSFKVEAYNTTLIGNEQSNYYEANVTPKASAPGGGGLIGGGQETVTVPISGAENSIDVKADVDGNTVTLDIDLDELNQIIENNAHTGNIVLDLSGLEKTPDTVIIPADAVTAIAAAVNDNANDAIGLTVDMGTATIELDPTTLDTIASTPGNLKLIVEQIHVSELGDTEKAQIGVDAVVLELQLWKGNLQIHDFNGGNVTVSIPYEGEPKDGMIIWRMATNSADEVELTPIRVTINKQTKCYEFQTGQFSAYVLAYFPFTDVDGGKWYYENVVYTFTNGFFEGTDITTFSPEATMTRAMLVTVLWRMEGEPRAQASDFTDLTADWYMTAVAWAAENGITEGYGNDMFGPDDTITREQIAALLYRYAKYKGYDVSGMSGLSGFDDASGVSDWAIPAMKWAVSSKIIQGDGKKLMPLLRAQRAQVAAILQRYSENEK